jgi:ribosomal protein L16/L10AE
MKSFPNTIRWKYKKFHRPILIFLFYLKKKYFYLWMSVWYTSIRICKLTAKQIESCRRTLRRTLGKSAKIVLRPFPSFPVTRKSLASRMGKVRVLFLSEFLL